MNNTHNVSYGGNNNVRNIAYSKCSSDNDEDSVRHAASSANKASATASTVKSYTKYRKEEGKDQDVVVLLPPRRKSRTPLVKHKLSVCTIT